MTLHISRVGALLGAVLLAGCSSVPTHYYTLVAADTGPSPATPPGPAFQLQSVRIPVQVDQPSLVVRQSQGDLAILDNERWAAPLADEFHDALAGRLEQALGGRDLAGMPKPAGVALLNIRADVRRFDSLPGNYALIDVVWSVTLNGDQPRSLTCGSRLRVPAQASLASIVLAHQQAIRQLANAIAGTGRALARDAQATCPG